MRCRTSNRNCAWRRLPLRSARRRRAWRSSSNRRLSARRSSRRRRDARHSRRRRRGARRAGRRCATCGCAAWSPRLSRSCPRRRALGRWPTAGRRSSTGLRRSLRTPTAASPSSARWCRRSTTRTLPSSPRGMPAPTRRACSSRNTPGSCSTCRTSTALCSTTAWPSRRVPCRRWKGTPTRPTRPTRTRLSTDGSRTTGRCSGGPQRTRQSTRTPSPSGAPTSFALASNRRNSGGS
mmetsp:Transcript_25125/g.59918  ORF Transcript_25125/g.59918 Transcript_25125/m.59918 type:complete len:236 (-) Transcript_25125:170-877(-)